MQHLKSRSVGLVLASLLVCLGHLHARQAVETVDPAAELASLLERFEGCEEGYRQCYEKFRPEFEQFVEQHPDSESALTARLWLLRNCWWHRQSGDMEARSQEVMSGILRHHAQSPELGKVAEYAYVFSKRKRAEFFGRIMEQSKHDAVKAAMMFGLGKDRVRSKKEDERAEGRELLEALAKRYGELAHRYTTYGEMAAAYLDPHAKSALKVGQTAPEIIGKDQNGRPMKLSDFRGKVVVLDFWGDW